jgi:hypothetical protein
VSSAGFGAAAVIVTVTGAAAATAPLSSVTLSPTLIVPGRENTRVMRLVACVSVS